MARNGASSTDEKLLQERFRAYQGSIGCPLRKLRFESQPKNPRQLDAKNIDRILTVFELQGCLRLEPENHIPALVSPATLSAIVKELPEGQRVLVPSVDKPPILSDIPCDLVCLNGQHRVEAAKRFLGAGDKWWIVDLYASDLSQEAQNTLREDYANSKNFYDGDIYRHLRRAHLRGDLLSKKKWLSRLSTTKQRDVKQFEKRTTRSFLLKCFSDALDALIPYMGLWPAFQIGTFHRILPLRCHEEMISYLRCIKYAWEKITRNTEILATGLDATTVSILEGRCPQVAEDMQIIEQDQSKIFPLIKGNLARQGIWRSLRSIDFIIPSLHTFLEDTKYLEPCAKILKMLLPKSSTRSVCQEFSRMHDGRCTLQVQLSERASELVHQPSAKDAHRQSYLQLWLYAMRHFPEMTGHAPRKDLLRTKPNVPKVEYIWWHGIANLARECGFENIVQAYPTVADADHRMAKDFLANVRPSPVFKISMDKASSYVQKLVEVIQCVGYEDETENGTPDPRLCSESQECGADVSSRCGIPHEQSFQYDCKWLFMNYMVMDLSFESSASNKYLTSFGVKKAMFHRFFTYELTSDDLNGHTTTSEDDEETPRLEEPVEETPRLDDAVEDVTMSQLVDQSTPILDQAAKRRRSMDDSSQDIHPSSVQETAVVPASYSLALSDGFIQEANVNRVRARQIYRNPQTQNLIIIKAKSSDSYDVLSIPRDRQREIVDCLGDKQGKFYFTSDKGKRLRANAPNDIVNKTQRPVLVVSSQDEKQVRGWFEEDEEIISV
ncbi:MAG: hypothetical protein Q9213_001785 [Squamulea squamosa]